MAELLAVALSVFGFAMFSHRSSMSPVTAPMVFTAIGLLLGTTGTDWFDLRLDSEVVSVLVEGTLVLVLFTDASRIDLRALRSFAALPTRLLGIGLPLTIITGTAAAALGQAVVSDRRLPARIRQTLNVESGLNDGIAGHRRSSAGKLEATYRQLAGLAIAVAAYAGAEVTGGNGFIAVFVAGLAFARVASIECADVQDLTEDEGELLTALTFLVFGAVLAAPRLSDLTWQIGVYAVASLTLVRVVPVLTALARTGTLLETRLFMGWFGPRGLASTLFALLCRRSFAARRSTPSSPSPCGPCC